MAESLVSQPAPGGRSGPLPDELQPIEQRILGALAEKQVTVPSTYPMTLNGLRIACNQTSSRDPVSTYADAEIEEACRGLKRKELLRIVVPSRGPRNLKYHQRLDERLGLAADERALLTVLLLRGPQTPGELRTRTERLHPFADREDVELCLTGLATRPVPLVRELPRRRGHHDHRWVHLLGPAPQANAAEQVAEAAEDDRQLVLSDGSEARNARVVAGYDAAAPAYAAAADLLDDKPFDRWLIDRIATGAAPGPYAEVGCGAGHLAARLARGGERVTGFDLSPGMVAEATDRYADVDGLSFEVADLMSLLRPRDAAAWSAVVAWFALVHLAPSELPQALAAMGRVLRPGGLLGLALYAGSGVCREDPGLEGGADLDFVLHDPEQVRAAAVQAGLTVTEWYRRGPLAGETGPDRCYLLLRVPD